MGSSLKGNQTQESGAEVMGLVSTLLAAAQKNRPTAGLTTTTA